MSLKKTLMISACGMVFALSSCKNGNFTEKSGQVVNTFAYLIEVFSSSTAGQWGINASALTAGGSVWSCWIEQAGDPNGTNFVKSSAKRFTADNNGMLTIALQSTCKSGAGASDLRVLCMQIEGNGDTKAAPFVNGFCS